MADIGSFSKVRIGLVLPDVMGTYGDGGNALVLRQRLRLRGIAAEPRWSLRQEKSELGTFEVFLHVAELRIKAGRVMARFGSCESARSPGESSSKPAEKCRQIAQRIQVALGVQ